MQSLSFKMIELTKPSWRKEHWCSFRHKHELIFLYAVYSLPVSFFLSLSPPLSLSIYLCVVVFNECPATSMHTAQQQTPCWADREAPVALSLFHVARSWSFRYPLIHVALWTQQLFTSVCVNSMKIADLLCVNLRSIHLISTWIFQSSILFFPLLPGFVFRHK